MTTSKLSFNRIEIRFARMGYFMPVVADADDRLYLAESFTTYVGDDVALEQMCAITFDPIRFREAVILLLEDIAFRGASQPESIVYSLIRETGCTPEQALEVLNHEL